MPDSPQNASRSLLDFDLQEIIGVGASGEVWRAVQRSTGRCTAVKLLSSALTPTSSEPERSARLSWRFQREIEAAAQQDHPHIAHVYASGVTDGHPWFAMELVDGPPLDEFAAALSLPERLALFQKVCAGVQHAHDGGVIHRDLKPANILVRADGTPKILDFGLACFLDDAGLGHTLSIDGQMLGTPMFMAPEQAAGKMSEIGVAADVYALGVILYQLVTGAWPFDEKLPPLQLLAAARENEPLSPRLVKPDIPGDLDAIILKAMEKQRDERYPSVRALADDITRFLDREPVRARAWTTGYLWRKRLRKHWRGFATAAFILGLSAAFLIVYLGERHRTAVRNAHALQQAKELVNSMIFDLHGRLETIGHPELLADVADRVAKFPWDIEPDATGQLDLHRFQALAAQVRGDVLLGNHNAPKALEAYQDAIKHLTTLARQHPGDLRFEIDAAKVRMAESNALSKSGHHREAIRNVKRLLSKLDRLQNAGANLQLDRLRGEAHRLAGESYRAGKAMEKAEKEFLAALAFFSLPTVADRRSLALVREDLADIRQKSSRQAEALSDFSEAEAYHRRAKSEAPQDGRISLDLSRCLARIALIHIALNDLAAAKHCLGEARDLCETRDAGGFATSLQCRRVANAYAALARASTDAGDDAFGIAADEEASLLWKVVAKLNPIQTTDRSAIFDLRCHKADTHLRLGQRTEAVASLRLALAQCKRILQVQRDDPRWCLANIDIELRLLGLSQPGTTPPPEEVRARFATLFAKYDALPARLKNPHETDASKLRTRLAEEMEKLDHPATSR